MKRIIIFFPFLFLLVIFLNCGKDLPQLPGLDLEIVQIELLDSLFLRAEIKFPSEDDKKNIEIRDVGFTLIHPNGTEEILDGKLDTDNGNQFSVSKINLGLEEHFQVNAFVEVYHKFDKQFKKFHSETVPFSTEGITLTTKIADITNGKVTIQTGVFGELVENQVSEIGLTWKTGPLALTINEADLVWDPIRINTNASNSFQALYEEQIEVPLGSANAYIFVRPYMIYRGEPIYGAMVSSQVGNFWEKVDTLPGEAGCRVGAIGFSIGKYGYAGLGVSNSNCDPSNLNSFQKDFWRYDSSMDIWEQMKPFPTDFEARYEATAFVIGDKAYVGLGRTISNQFKDFWEYDPNLDEWTKKTNFPNERRSVVSFVIDGKGYVGTGKMCDKSQCDCLTYLCFQNDFYEFDPEGLDTLGLPNGTWTQKASLPDTDVSGNPLARLNAVGFSIGNKGYLTTGLAQNTIDSLGRQLTGTNSLVLRNPRTDLWEYDPSTDHWTQKADLPSRPREKAVGFSMGDFGYIATGGNQGFGTGISSIPTESDFWRYDPKTDEWTELANIIDIRRWRAVSLVIDNTAYIGMGIAFKDSSIKIDPNFYRYTPQE